jgi:hypothetical protein
VDGSIRSLVRPAFASTSSPLMKFCTLRGTAALRDHVVLRFGQRYTRAERHFNNGFQLSLKVGQRNS